MKHEMQINFRLIRQQKCRIDSGTIYPVIQIVQLHFCSILTFTMWSSKYEEIKKNKTIFALKSSRQSKERRIPFKYQRFIFLNRQHFCGKNQSWQNWFKNGNILRTILYFTFYNNTKTVLIAWIINTIITVLNFYIDQNIWILKMTNTSKAYQFKLANHWKW